MRSAVKDYSLRLEEEENDEAAATSGKSTKCEKDLLLLLQERGVSVWPRTTGRQTDVETGLFLSIY